jgi:hypothetical protein
MNETYLVSNCRMHFKLKMTASLRQENGRQDAGGHQAKNSGGWESKTNCMELQATCEDASQAIRTIRNRISDSDDLQVNLIIWFDALPPCVFKKITFKPKAATVKRRMEKTVIRTSQYVLFMKCY